MHEIALDRILGNRGYQRIEALLLRHGKQNEVGGLYVGVRI